MSDNLRGIALMLAATLSFTSVDMGIKLSVDHLPLGQIISVMGVGGFLLFGLVAKAQGIRLTGPIWRDRGVLIRGCGELMATGGITLALANAPFSTVSAILQAAPLLVVLGAAVFLKERVGWRRWSILFLGMVGVLIILAPTETGPLTGLIYALIGVLGISVRDLATRFVAPGAPTMQVSFVGFSFVILSGVVLCVAFPEPWVWPDALAGGYLALAVIAGFCAYFLITAAMRVGEIAVVAPFRYFRILFAFTVGWVVFDEVISARVWLGTGLIVAAGLYILFREGNRVKTLARTARTR